MKHKFKIGDKVGYQEEGYTIVQLRFEYGLPYYRLDSGKIVSERFLY